MARRVVLCFLAGFLLNGCAARARSFEDRFITRGEPGVRIGAPLNPTIFQSSLESYTGQLRRLAANARPAGKSSLVTAAETWDPELASALLILAAAPTPENHRRVADAYRRLRILDAAHAHYSRAVRLDPTNAAAYDGLARIWRDWGTPHLGLGDAVRAIYFAPSSASARNTMGTLLYALGRKHEARANFELALTLDPQASYALNNLCYLFLMDRETAGAIAACRHALEVDASALATRNNLALVYAADGDLASAERELAGISDPALRYYNTGIVYLARRRFAEAAQAFERALALRPTLMGAQKRVRQARALAEQSRTLQH